MLVFPQTIFKDALPTYTIGARGNPLNHKRKSYHLVELSVDMSW